MSAEIVQSKRKAEAARRQFSHTLTELQVRLRPGTLASNAWEGVKDKSGELADDAMQAVKARPVAVSAALAAFTLFLARAPIKSAVAGLLTADEEQAKSPPARKGRPTNKAQPKKAARRRRTSNEE